MAQVHVGEGEEDEELEQTSSKPAFGGAAPAPAFAAPTFGSAAPTLSVAIVKDGEEDEEDGPPSPAPTFGGPTFGFPPSPTASSGTTARSKSVLIFEGEEEEETEQNKAPTQPTAATATAPANSAQDPQNVPRSAGERRLRDTNESLRKLQAKKIVSVFEASRKELIQVSDSVNSGLRTLQDTYTATSQLNEKIAVLSLKVGQLPTPFRLGPPQ